MESGIVQESPDGRYVRYNEILGCGAFKEVYKGFDQVNGTEVAWNQICLDDNNDYESNKFPRYDSEPELLKSLNHESIMKCYCYWVDPKQNNFNMITELLSCGNLRKYRKKHKFLDLKTVKSWAKQILEGLQYLHTQNPPIVHRDIKSDNIFINGDQSQVKIGDFGLAIVNREGTLSTVVGTADFMAPEYYEEEYNELVDVYAFGMCMLELITGEKPYKECQNCLQIYKKVSSGVKPNALGKIEDPQLKEFIDKCLAPAPLRLSATELLKDSFLSAEIPKELMSRSTNMAESDRCAFQEAIHTFKFLEMENCGRELGIVSHASPVPVPVPVV